MNTKDELIAALTAKQEALAATIRDRVSAHGQIGAIASDIQALERLIATLAEDEKERKREAELAMLTEAGRQGQLVARFTNLTSEPAKNSDWDWPTPY